MLESAHSSISDENNKDKTIHMCSKMFDLVLNTNMNFLMCSKFPTPTKDSATNTSLAFLHTPEKTVSSNPKTTKKHLQHEVKLLVTF